MAAPQIVQTVGGNGNSFATGAGTAVGDYLVAWQATGLTGAGPPAQPGGTYTSGWAVAADLTAQANGAVKVWYRRITDSGGAKTVSVTGGNATYGNFLAVAVIRDASDINFLDGSVSTVYGASALTIPANTTTSVAESLVFAFWFVNHVSGTPGTMSPPAGMTSERNAQTGNSGIVLASEVRSTVGLVGSRTLTSNKPGGAYPSGAVLLAIRPSALPVGFADAASSSESFGIAASSTTADQATGSETFGIAASTGIVDQATGSETFGLFTVTGDTDYAVGSETWTVDELGQVPLVDQATGGEQFDISAIQNPVTDQATGSEAWTLQRQSTISDQATGTETWAFLRQSEFTDQATGSVAFSIIEVADTQVLPLRTGRIYELVLMARIHQAAGPPTLDAIDSLRWSSMTIRDIVAAPQELTATCTVSTLPEVVLAHMREPADFPFELHVLRDGQTVFAGPFEVRNGKTSQEVELHARGLLSYLSWMHLGFDKPFLAVDQAAIVKTLVDAYQLGEHAHLGIDTSRMAPTGRTIDYTHVRDELTSVAKLADDIGKAEGGFDIEVDPATRQLICWSPFKGTDRSDGEDAIIIDPSAITDGSIVCSVAGDDLATDIHATGTRPGGDAPFYVEVGNPELRARYGKKVITRSWSNIATEDELLARATAALAVRGTPLIVPGAKVRVTPDADISQYHEGDTIAYEIAGALGASGALRIRSRAVTIDAKTGHELVDLEPA